MLTMLDQKSIKNLIKRERELKQNPVKALIKHGLKNEEIRKLVEKLPELGFYKHKAEGIAKLNRILGETKIKTNIPTEEGEFKETQERIEFKGKSSKIHNVEELVKEYNIDPNIWKPIKFVKKLWDMGYKDANDEGQSLPLYSIHAEFKMIEGANEAKKLIEYFKKEISKLPAVEWPITKTNKSGQLLLELCIFDLHLGKLSWHEESGGGNYDSSIAVERYKAAVKDLIDAAPMDKITDILLPCGNDFFHTDGYEGQTTAGTPQDTDSRWQNTFLKGCNMLKQVIAELAGYDKRIHIAIVQGNHDYERSFYLGEVLSAYFHNHPNVTVNNAPTLRKYFRFGNTLIGFTHGDKEKLQQLPLVMAVERKEDWAETDFHSWHLGHLHKEGETEINGVTINYFSSLCSTDAWHNSKSYIGNRKLAKALLFDYDKGVIANYYHIAK